MCAHTESKFLADCIKNIDVCKNHGIIVVSFIAIKENKMARTINYTKDAVIFHEGMPSEYVYYLQSGSVAFSRYDVSLKRFSSVKINQGEFFGLKDALGSSHCSSKAVALVNCTVVALTPDEFEQVIIKNHALSMKLLSALSLQLKTVHERLLAGYGAEKETDCECGLFKTAKGFYNSEEYQPCIDVCERFLKNYAESKYREEIKQLLKSAWAVVADTEIIKTPSLDEALKEFAMLDFFKRFEKTFPPNQIIFSEFETGNHFYLIRSGVVRTVKCIRDVNRTISLSAPGDFFGVNGLFGGNIRDVSCISTDVVQTLEFTYEQLDAIITANPKFAFMLLKLLSRSINGDMMLVNNMFIFDLPTRLKDMLIMFDLRGFSQKLEGFARKIYVTPHDVAVWTNMSEDAVEAEMKDMQVRGLIQMEDDYVVVRNLEEIKRLYMVEMKSAQRID